jgi:uncharacterized membrane protein
MTTFTVWRFDDPHGAEQATTILEYAAADGLVKVVDRAVVAWPVGAAGPELRHRHDATWRRTGWGAFWGVMIGALFLVPVVGGAVGAAVGAVRRATDGTGITREQLETIRTGITEGTSALFLVTEGADLDRLGERFHGLHNRLVTTNLTEAERDILLETFGRH